MSRIQRRLTAASREMRRKPWGSKRGTTSPNSRRSTRRLAERSRTRPFLPHPGRHGGRPLRRLPEAAVAVGEVEEDAIGGGGHEGRGGSLSVWR